MTTQNQLDQMRPPLKEYYPMETWNTIAFIVFNLLFGPALILEAVHFPFDRVIGVDVRVWGAAYLIHGLIMLYLLKVKNDWQLIRRGSRIGFIIKFCWALQLLSLCIQGAPAPIYYLLFGSIMLLYFQAGTYVNLPAGKTDAQ